MARDSGGGYNFTMHVRSVLQKSRVESAGLHHEFVGTEHILLALLQETESIAVTALKAMSVDGAAVRTTLLEVVKKGRAEITDHQELPYTSRAKKVLELAMTEARELGHNYVGTEHLLLGLIREEKGIAAQVLMDRGVELDVARREVLRITRERGIEPVRGAPDSASAAAGPSSVPTEFTAWRSMTHELGYHVLWWTLGIVALVESAGLFARQLSAEGTIDWYVGLLAGTELAGAVLLLVPRTMRTGAKILLAIFTIAIVTRLARGEFPGPIFVQAAATFFMLVEETRGMKFRVRQDKGS